MELIFFPGFISITKGNLRNRSCILKFGLENSLKFLTTWIIWLSYGFKMHTFLRFIYAILWITDQFCYLQDHMKFLRSKEQEAADFRRISILFQGELHWGEDETNRMEDASKIEGHLFQELYRMTDQQLCQTLPNTAPMGQPTGFYLLCLCDKIPVALKILWPVGMFLLAVQLWCRIYLF